MIYNEVDCEPVEIEGYGLCFFETQYGYPTEVQTVYADLRELIAAVHGIWYNEPCYLMTITNTATGETDPWGIMYDGVAVPIVYTIEEAVAVYESFDVRALNEYYVSVHGHKPAHIETWDTLKYYDDLVFWDVEENEYNKPWGYGKVAR